MCGCHPWDLASTGSPCSSHHLLPQGQVQSSGSLCFRPPTSLPCTDLLHLLRHLELPLLQQRVAKAAPCRVNSLAPKGIHPGTWSAGSKSLLLLPGVLCVARPLIEAAARLKAGSSRVHDTRHVFHVDPSTLRASIGISRVAQGNQPVKGTIILRNPHLGGSER